MSISRIHMDPTIFPDPYSFRPDRWMGTPADRARLEKHLVPFGRGARMCVGQKWVPISLSVLYCITHYCTLPFSFFLFFFSSRRHY